MSIPVLRVCGVCEVIKDVREVAVEREDSSSMIWMLAISFIRGVSSWALGTSGGNMVDSDAMLLCTLKNK